MTLEILPRPLYRCAALVTVLAWAAKCYNFNTSCSLHGTEKWEKYGFPTPKQSLPAKASLEWLHAEPRDILSWYNIGKKECFEYLEKSLKDPAFIKKSKSHAGFIVETDKIPANGQRQCRGRNTLFDYTGMILWPFGPYKECPTYSNCWFGVLSCGQPKAESIRNTLSIHLQKIFASNSAFKGTNIEIPPFTHWSLRAMKLYITVSGNELVTPEQRYISISDLSDVASKQDSTARKHDDVIIAQYHLTKPHTTDDALAYKLHIRMYELYTNMLLNWKDQELIDKFSMPDLAALYLGGRESRCRPFTKCTIGTACCGCDQESFVLNTPAVIRSEDGSHKCGQQLIDSQLNLPLCPALDSSRPGRWILSSSPDIERVLKCDEDEILTLFNAKLVDIKATKADLLSISSDISTKENGKWLEASGDPCIVHHKEKEDRSRSHWFYAPYSCKYHFYTREEAFACLKDKGISHMHFHGDSMSRDLFSYVSRYLGLAASTEQELKHLTNDLHNSEIAFNNSNLILSEGYSWDYNLAKMKLVERPPVPQVYISNYAFAHNFNQMASQFRAHLESTEELYWKGRLGGQHKQDMGKGRGKDQGNKRSQGPTLPQYRFLQNDAELHGRRNSGWTANGFRKRGQDLWEGSFEKLGFHLLDEHLFSMGRLDAHNEMADGWHFAGTKRQMEVIALFNMICNA